jgi:hypothetical protein
MKRMTKWDFFDLYHRKGRNLRRDEIKRTYERNGEMKINATMA